MEKTIMEEENGLGKARKKELAEIEKRRRKQLKGIEKYVVPELVNSGIF